MKTWRRRQSYGLPLFGKNWFSCNLQMSICFWNKFWENITAHKKYQMARKYQIISQYVRPPDFSGWMNCNGWHSLLHLTCSKFQQHLLFFPKRKWEALLSGLLLTISKKITTFQKTQSASKENFGVAATFRERMRKVSPKSKKIIAFVGLVGQM